MCEPILIKGDYIFMQDNKNFLAAEPIGKLLLKLSIPTVIAQLINMLYNIVDRIYIPVMAVWLLLVWESVCQSL